MNPRADPLALRLQKLFGGLLRLTTDFGCFGLVRVSQLNLDGLAEQRLGLVEPAAGPEQPAEAAQVRRVIGVSLAERRAADRQRLSEKGLGRLGVALHDQQEGELVQSCGVFRCRVPYVSASRAMVLRWALVTASLSRRSSAVSRMSWSRGVNP